MSAYLTAFVVGGIICVIGQCLMDLTRMTPAHVLSTLVVSGVVVDFIGWYDPLINWAGAGVTVPITSFGHSLYHGAIAEAEENGLVGIVTGIFEVPSAGISSAIIFAFIMAVFFKPKG